MADERKKNLTSPIARWIDANRETAGFTESLRKLLMYACVEWIRRGTSALLTPEEALSKIVCCGLSEFPVIRRAERSKSGSMRVPRSKMCPDRSLLTAIKCFHAKKKAIIGKSLWSNRILKYSLFMWKTEY